MRLCMRMVLEVELINNVHAGTLVSTMTTCLLDAMIRETQKAVDEIESLA